MQMLASTYPPVGSCWKRCDITSCHACLWGPTVSSLTLPLSSAPPLYATPCVSDSLCEIHTYISAWMMVSSVQYRFKLLKMDAKYKFLELHCKSTVHPCLIVDIHAAPSGLSQVMALKNGYTGTLQGMHSGSKNCPNVWLFWSDWFIAQQPWGIIFKEKRYVIVLHLGLDTSLGLCNADQNW